MHRLLQRQIQKYFSEEDQSKFRKFLSAIDSAYVDFDSDLSQLENVLEKKLARAV